MEKRELELRAAMQLLMSASARVLCDAGAQKVFTSALLAVVNELKPENEKSTKYVQWRVWEEPRNGRKNSAWVEKVKRVNP